MYNIHISSLLPENSCFKCKKKLAVYYRLHGFSLTLSRLPTFRRKMEEVVKALLQEARKKMENDHDIEETSKATHAEGDIL